ncbi:serine hydrolase domain-containing protein [Sphingobium baderi]|nr:serine hydrolase domain-containing protein [Sphingobium baderi]
MAQAHMTGFADRDAARDVGMDPDRIDALVAYFDRTYVASGKLPHLQLLLSRDERIVLSVSGGRARASGEPLCEDALFRIASMTKPVTSVAFMMLVEQGLVALDDPVTDVVPEFARLRVGMEEKALKRPMRMIDLLRHTSGFTYGLQRRTAIDARYRELGLDEFQQKRSSDDFIAALADIPLEFSPGENWNYSVSTDVLGVVAERLTGMDLESLFRARIFDPLGMPDTFFTVPADRVDRLTDAWRFVPGGGLALGDRGARSGWSRPLRFRAGGGGLVSSTGDYHRFARMLLRGGELDGVRLLRSETVEAMRTNQLPGGRDLTSMSTGMFSEVDYAGLGFGLGFAMELGTQVYSWGGIFSTHFFIDPVERMIAILMTQHLPSNIHPIRNELRVAARAAIK